MSGFSTKQFSFYGFLPLNKKLRKEKFDELKKKKNTIILYEAPHKLLNTLNDILKKYRKCKYSISKRTYKNT